MIKYDHFLTNAKVCIFEPIGNPNGIEIGSDAASELEESMTNFLLSPNSRSSKTPVRK